MPAHHPSEQTSAGEFQRQEDAFRDSDRTKPGKPLGRLDEFESTDPINRFRYLSEAYLATDPAFSGRVTVPVLWDKETKRIINNCEDDICPMFNTAFDEFAANKTVDFFPKDIEAEHAKVSDFLYENINNGVYRAGLATRQRTRNARARIRDLRSPLSPSALDELLTLG